MMKKILKWNKESAMIVILAGILCLVVVWPEGGKGESPSKSVETIPASEETALNAYVENQEERLKALLEQIEGVGKIRVMIRAKASKEYVVEKDVTTNGSSIEETDSQGGSRLSKDTNRSETSVYTTDGSGNDIPWVIKEMEPQIEGVVVAAEGGGSEAVANEITEAV